MNVHPQISALHTQPETIDPLPNRLHPHESAMQPHEISDLPAVSPYRVLAKSKARMQFTVDEDQVLVLRRVLLSAAGQYLSDLRINTIKSKQIAKIVIDIEANIVDHIMARVIHTMKRVELGQICFI